MPGDRPRHAAPPARVRRASFSILGRVGEDGRVPRHGLDGLERPLGVLGDGLGHLARRVGRSYLPPQPVELLPQPRLPDRLRAEAAQGAVPVEDLLRALARPRRAQARQLLLDLIVFQVRLEARSRGNHIRGGLQRPNQCVHLGPLTAPHNHGVGRLAAVAEAARLVHCALAADGVS